MWAGQAGAVENIYVTINKNQPETNSRKVTLYFSGPTKVVEMKVSNLADFKDAEWEYYKMSKIWYLEYGKGIKKVYVRFKDKNKNLSQVYSGTIKLSVPDSMAVDFKINKGAKDANSRYVSLELTYSVGVEEFRISNSMDFSASEWGGVVKTVNWALASGSGEKIVYVEFKDAAGVTKVASRKINYIEPKHYIPEGTLLKGQASTVYYLGYDGKIHPFVNSAIYHSWNADFSDIQSVSNVKLSQYPVGQPVCVREGTWLVKFRSQATIYAVEPGCRLRLIRSEGEARIIYGVNWAKRVLELDPILESYYTLEYPEYDSSKIDKDKDGVEKTVESEYGASDSKMDSDGDGLTDFEEIYYWYSDPAQEDTDTDGHKDGAEVATLYSPVGAEKIDSMPAGAYVYPMGSLIVSSGQYYYRSYNGNYYFVSKKKTDTVFKANKFESKFAIISPLTIPFSVGKNKLGTSDGKIIKPQLRASKGSLFDL